MALVLLSLSGEDKGSTVYRSVLRIPAIAAPEAEAKCRELGQQIADIYGGRYRVFCRVPLGRPA